MSEESREHLGTVENIGTRIYHLREHLRWGGRKLVHSTLLQGYIVNQREKGGMTALKVT